jgi:hypothetical protein
MRLVMPATTGPTEHRKIESMSPLIVHWAARRRTLARSCIFRSSSVSATSMTRFCIAFELRHTPRWTPEPDTRCIGSIATVDRWRHTLSHDDRCVLRMQPARPASCRHRPRSRRGTGPVRASDRAACWLRMFAAVGGCSPLPAGVASPASGCTAPGPRVGGPELRSPGWMCGMRRCSSC